MKTLKLLLLPALMFCCLTMTAQTSNSKKAKTEKTSKKSSKKSKKQEAPAEVVDTVSIDEFSFHFGRANTGGLKNYLVQRMGVDPQYMDDFMKGFEQKELTVEDKKMKARLAGIEIRQQVEEQVIPQVAMQIDENNDKLNHEKFIEGFRTGVMEVEVPGIDMDSTQNIVRKNVEYYHKAQMEAKYGENRKQGEEFLAKNAKNDSVKVTASGLQYKILTKGTGDIPTIDQTVKVHYRGTLIDGTEFDSSYKRGEPASFGCGQVISGWTEALTMMPVGSKWMLYIPYDLAYGDRETGTIKPFSMLIFEVELLGIEK